MPEQIARTKYQAILDTQYGATYHRFCRRFYRHVSKIFAFIVLMGGTAAVGGFMASSAGFGTFAALLMAVTTVMDQLLSPAVRSEQHKFHSRKFSDLDAQAESLSFEELEIRLKYLQSRGPDDGPQPIRWIAYNDTVTSKGHTDLKEPETKTQRIFRVLC